MTKVEYLVEYWQRPSLYELMPCYQISERFTSKAKAIKLANSLGAESKARVRKHTTKTEIIWCAKTLRGDTRSKKK